MKRVMKNVRKRLGAFALMFAMVMPLVCGAQTEVKADPSTEEDLIALEVEEASPSLEIGDTITVDIKLTKALSSFHYVEGTLKYEADKFEVENVEAVNEAGSGNSLTIGWDSQDSSADQSGHQLESVTVMAINNSGIDVAANTVLAKVTLKVKKSVATTTDISYEEVRIASEDTNYTATFPSSIIVNKDVRITVTNSMSGNRKVELIIPDKINVPTNGQSPLNTVSVPIYIKSNTGFDTLHIELAYLSDMLQYDSYSVSSAVRAKGANCQVDFTNGAISISFASSRDINMTGELITINFKAGTRATLGATTTIVPSIPALGTDPSAVHNSSEVAMTASIATESGSPACEVAFIKGFDLGDVNMDGKINLIDATYVLQSYNGIRTLTSDQALLADVNKSGTVTLVDALLIMKFYNGAINSF